MAGMCFIWKLMEYTKDRRPNAPIIRKFYTKFLWPKLQQVFPGKVAVKLIITNFFAREKYVRNKRKENKTKTKSVKPKLMKTLSMNQYYTIWSSDFLFRAYH